MVHVRTAEGKERLLPLVAPGNREKARQAPVTSILAADGRFHDRLPELFPVHEGLREAFEARVPADRDEHARFNAALQIGYFLLAARAVGLSVAATDTDGWIVCHRGRVLAEHYLRGMEPARRHLLMSVSKSLVGTVVGALVARGELDPAQPVTRYVPELENSGYAGAQVRHLLDMRSGIRFSEEYLDPQADVRVLEQAIGWAPRLHPGVPHTMYDFLLTLRQQGPHGGPFEYRSAETDVLGWVCEAAAGVRMPELMSRTLWSRLGAENDAVIAVDSAGAGMYDGGICAALRDMARFGAMIARRGTSLTGEQVVPESWVEDTLRADADTRAAFAISPTETLMPGGMYRNQFWLPYPDRDVLLCLGIHGQMIYINPVTDVVAAKLSSWPEPQHAWKLFSTLRAFDTISSYVA